LGIHAARLLLVSTRELLGLVLVGIVHELLILLFLDQGEEGIITRELHTSVGLEGGLLLLLGWLVQVRQVLE
jgi:hypothetical protein